MAKSLIMRLKKDKAPRLVVLSKTRHITEDDVNIHACWELLKEGYEEMDSDPNAEWEDKAMHSILNSIVYQQRIFFCFERNNMRVLLSTDTNWKKEKLTLDNNKYSFLRQQLVEKGIIELYDGTKKMKIYRVIHPEVLEMIKVDSPEEQLNQVIDFIGNNSLDGKSDGKSDVERQKERKAESQSVKAKPFVEKEEPVITFEDLLFKQYEEDYPKFKELDFFAALVLDYIPEFEFDNFNKNKFIKHMENVKKPTAERVKHIKKLAKRFEHEINRVVSLKNIGKIELKNPTPIINNPVLKNYDDADVAQANTINAAKNFQNKETIDVLKRKIKNEENPRIKQQLECQLNYWESVVNG